MQRTTMLPLIAAIALALAACATTDDDPDPAAASDAGSAPDSGASAETIAVGVTELGEVLVDGNGRTLYVFDPDAQGPSTCEDGCAENWPPVVVDGEPTADAGVDGGLLGTAPRSDGTIQATYDGWPLYLWVGDSAPGDANGQGVQDVWWVVAPDGSVLRDPAETDPDPEPEPTTGSDYDY